MDQELARRTFRRADRLRATRDYQRVSRRGRRASSRSFVVLAARRGVEAQPGDAARVGLTVSRKVGNAVVRNRVKRRLRGWFRNSPTRTASYVDFVVIARPSAARLQGAALHEELDDLCNRAAGALA